MGHQTPAWPLIVVWSNHQGLAWDKEILIQEAWKPSLFDTCCVKPNDPPNPKCLLTGTSQSSQTGRGQPYTPVFIQYMSSCNPILKSISTFGFQSNIYAISLSVARLFQSNHIYCCFLQCRVFIPSPPTDWFLNHNTITSHMSNKYMNGCPLH